MAKNRYIFDKDGNYAGQVSDSPISPISPDASALLIMGALLLVLPGILWFYFVNDKASLTEVVGMAAFFDLFILVGLVALFRKLERGARPE